MRLPFAIAAAVSGLLAFGLVRHYMVRVKLGPPAKEADLIGEWLVTNSNQKFSILFKPDHTFFGSPRGDFNGGWGMTIPSRGKWAVNSQGVLLLGLPPVGSFYPHRDGDLLQLVGESDKSAVFAFKKIP